MIKKKSPKISFSSPIFVFALLAAGLVTSGFLVGQTQNLKSFAVRIFPAPVSRIRFTCFDSDADKKPNDIYIKGSVAYTDKNGVRTVASDECAGSKQQVNEMWCYESPARSGNYVQGKMVYNCPRGCLNGACVK